ncbi:MAG: TIGR04222 domain-containing membrane protein [Verrucomicrobiota bacterium]
MNASDLGLWEKLQRFEFDEDADAVFSFRSRLAEENGWTLEFATRAIDEYRKFVFLAMRAGHMVTPSEEIDEVWHLHLIYTQSYWARMCGEILGKPLHHHPTAGGSAEGNKFWDCYEQTLASYERFFGEPAPADIWPAAAERFRGRSAPKKRRLPWKNIAWAGSAAAGAVALTGCAHQLTSLSEEVSATAFLVFYAIAAPLAFGLSFLIASRLRQYSAKSDVVPTDAYEIAFLNGGRSRMIVAALARLTGLGLIRSRMRKQKSGDLPVVMRIAAEPEVELAPIERSLLKAIPENGSAVEMREIVGSMKWKVEEVRSKLESDGLVLSSSRRRYIGWMAALPVLVLLAVGLTRLAIGIDRDVPFGFLLFMMIGTAVALGFRLWGLKRRTPSGARALRTLKRCRSEVVAKFKTEGAASPFVAAAVAIGGLATVAHAGGFDGFVEPAKHLEARTTSSHACGGGGCGNSCGGGCGSGCGGGCGGCGG